MEVKPKVKQKIKPEVRPVVKWVGGKRQLLSRIKAAIPKNFTTYYEPFIGGGAVLFALQPHHAVVNDINRELINMYQVIQTNVDELINDLKKHKNNADYFYKMRDQDRDKDAYQQLSDIKRASRMIYLNKTCYNGLFRVNSNGEFNTPFGKYKNPNIVNEHTLRAVSDYFKRADITFRCEDFTTSLQGIDKDSFVYFDPPYDPISPSANFTGYNKGGFGQEEQVRLKILCDELDGRGIRFLLSNSATDFILDLYQDYNIKIVPARRAVNSHGDKRGNVAEVLVQNYK